MALIKPGDDARHLRLVAGQSMAWSSASSLVACYIASMPLRTTFSSTCSILMQSTSTRGSVSANSAISCMPHCAASARAIPMTSECLPHNEVRTLPTEPNQSVCWRCRLGDCWVWDVGLVLPQAMTAVQREEPIAGGGRTHRKRYQAGVRFRLRRRLE